MFSRNSIHDVSRQNRDDNHLYKAAFKTENAYAKMPMFVEALIKRLLKKISIVGQKGNLVLQFFGQERPIFQAIFFLEFSTNFLKFSVNVPKEMQHFPLLKQCS